jgi:poly(3-hydroxybutyrate) depolymerase
MEMHRTSGWICSCMCLALAGATASAKVLDQTTTIGGVTLRYKVVLPADYDAGKSYPGILAFPPGAQDMNMVMTTLQQNWAGPAQRRGYIVVIPAAPEGRLFYQEGARVFPAFLDQLLAAYPIRDRKFHIAGMSNGGLSAFFIAAAYPQYFTSVTGFPGFLPDATPERIAALKGMCIHMHVGELDTGWRNMMEEQAAEFRAKGMAVDISVEKGQSHVMSTLMGEGAARLFDEIEKSPQGCGK